MTDITIQNLATFDIGHLPDDHLALLLAYATTPERLARNEMESVVVGLSHDMARQLAEALLRHANRTRQRRGIRHQYPPALLLLQIEHAAR